MVKEGKIRSRTKIVLGVGAVLLALIYTFTAGGVVDLQGYFVPIVAFVLFGVMVFEVGVSHYFNKSVYKKLTIKDFINFVILLFAGAVFVQGILFIPSIKDSVPAGIISFFNNIALIVGVGAVLFSLGLLSTKD